MLLSCETKIAALRVGARDSILSQAQVKEVRILLQKHYPKVNFQSSWMSSPGDRDQKTSLRELEKTDFFTRDLDTALREGTIRIAIHSAKDLPEPLPEDLRIVALTQTLDPRDMLVFSTTHERRVFPKRPVIGVSSKRREIAVKQRYSDAICKEIRGSIIRRLEQLDLGDYDAIVVPECALLRLGLTQCFRVPLHSTPAPLQGQLAVVARRDDNEMEQLFNAIDTRN